MKKQRATLLAGLVGGAIGAVAVRRSGLKARLIAHLPWLSGDDSVLKDHFPVFAVGVACWVLFSLYWEAAAKSAAAAEKTESRSSRGVHVALISLAQLLILIPIRGLGRYYSASSSIMLAGLAVEAMGILLAVWARRHLGRNWSGAIAIKVKHQLIRSGPYRLLRHPIYTGVLTMYIGTAILTGERLALAGLVLAGVAYWRKIRLEEAALQSAFGREYEDYRRATWALLPGLF